MKALTLRYDPGAPWPDWVFAGHKTIETRTWSTTYRGDLLC